MIIPVALNLVLFGIFIVALVLWILPWLTAFSVTIAFGAWGKGLIWVATLLLVLMVYAFVFPMIAEVVGAPFYEAIGARIDEDAKQPIVERPWYAEVKAGHRPRMAQTCCARLALRVGVRFAICSRDWASLELDYWLCGSYSHAWCR